VAPAWRRDRRGGFDDHPRPVGVFLVARLQPVPELSPWNVALILGICVGLLHCSRGDPSLHRLATRVGDLDDVFPIVLGGLALALVHEISTAAAVWLTVQAITIALAVAVGGWVLITESASDSEQRVFTVGTVLLLGGVAEFLSASALLSGLVAGALWGSIGGGTRENIARDVRHMQHPLVVLLLIIAGARAGFSLCWPRRWWCICFYASLPSSVEAGW
jgi:hypothetical protein